ncbi:MAG: nucleoside hydrolase [Bacteroidota bacterium]|nr:nucleoside hydrolase [Bacteroidota bacterium]
MIKKILLLFLITGCSFYAVAQRSKPVNVIFDTDMASDYDDVGAITLLHYYADMGKANILATIASSKYPRVAAVLNVFNTYFNRPGIPIGVPTGTTSEDPDWQHWSDTLVAKYPHKIKTNADATGAVKLYRKILAAQPDTSVTIITVGFFTNIADLMQSQADEYSPLTGKQLIEKKVAKLVSMGGRFPSGSEYNMNHVAPPTVCVFKHWTRPVIFSGYEIGAQIHTGIPLINNSKITNSPVKDVFRISIPQAKEDANGRMSWDETAVLVGITGAAPYFNLHYGRVIVNADASNSWIEGGNQAYLTFARPAAEIEAFINNLIMHQPVK